MIFTFSNILSTRFIMNTHLLILAKKQSILILLVALTLLSVSCINDRKLDDTKAEVNTEKLKYSEVSEAVIKATFKDLSTALQGAMKEGGVKKAVDFCEGQAIPITNGVANEMGVTLARVSDKPRNPINAASEYEKELINDYAVQLKSTSENIVLASTHRTTEGSDSPTIYKPIIIKGLCLNCHGEVGKTLTEENNAFIKQFYPNDMATGYQEGEVRGLWKVVFTN